MTLTSAIKAAKQQGFDIEMDNTEIIVYLPGETCGWIFKRTSEEKAIAFIEEHLDEDDAVTGGPTSDMSDYDY